MNITRICGDKKNASTGPRDRMCTVWENVWPLLSMHDMAQCAFVCKTWMRELMDPECSIRYWPDHTIPPVWFLIMRSVPFDYELLYHNYTSPQVGDFCMTRAQAMQAFLVTDGKLATLDMVNGEMGMRPVRGFGYLAMDVLKLCVQRWRTPEAFLKETGRRNTRFQLIRKEAADAVVRKRKRVYDAYTATVKFAKSLVGDRKQSMYNNAVLVKTLISSRQWKLGEYDTRTEEQEWKLQVSRGHINWIYNMRYHTIDDDELRVFEWMVKQHKVFDELWKEQRDIALATVKKRMYKMTRSSVWPTVLDAVRARFICACTAELLRQDDDILKRMPQSLRKIVGIPPEAESSSK